MFQNIFLNIYANKELHSNDIQKIYNNCALVRIK